MTAITRGGFAFTLVVVAVSAGGAAVQTDGGVATLRPGTFDKERLGKAVARSVTQRMREEHVPGAVVAIVKDGAILLAEGYGVADVNRGAPVDPERTIFRIGSVSKAVTGLAVLHAADRGLLDLDSDVNEYLQQIKVDGTFAEPVTARHLLSHTGGFDQPGLGRNFTDQAQRPNLVKFLKRDLRRIRRPGEQSCYDTYGISLAGHLLEAVSGSSYDDYMREEIFKPLEMNRTHVETPGPLVDDVAGGYHFDGGKYVREPYEYYASTPASSIDATAVDMAKWMIAVLDESNGFLSADARKELRTVQYRMDPEFAGFAFGFWEELTPQGRVLHHGGTMRGYSANLVLFPALRIGVFVAANRDSETGPRTRLVYSVVDDLRRRWFKTPAENSEPSPPDLSIATDRFAGAYIPNLYCHHCREGEGWPPSDAITRVVSVGEGKISLNGRECVAVGRLRFRDRSGMVTLVFSEGADGAISGFGLKQDLPGMTHEKLDERMLRRVLGEDWASQSASPLVALVCRATEQWAKAAEAYRAIASSSPNAPIPRGIALYRLGQCSLQGGAWADAGQAFHEARRVLRLLVTDDAFVKRRARRLMARTLLLESETRTRQGDLDRAFALIHEAIDDFGLPADEIARDLRESPNHRTLVADPRFRMLTERAPDRKRSE